jgi:tetratricopeptide (TPR) repeat protein
MRRVLIAALAAALVLAHGPLHEQIEAVTEEIRKDPGDASLYLKRGELQRHHGDWTAASADYDRASRRNPSLAESDLCRARMWLEAGKPELALAPAERFLDRRPHDAEALSTRAAALARTGRPRDAALDYDRAVAASSRPDVELYLARASAWQAAGESESALRALDEGIGLLGPLVTLEVAAVDIDKRLRRWDSALERISLVARQAPRKETWLVRRAGILEEAGRAAAAREAYEQALRAIESLSPGQRRTRATMTLERQVRAALQ